MILPSLSNYTRDHAALDGAFYTRTWDAEGTDCRRAPDSPVRLNIEESKTHSHSHVPSGTHNECTQAWRLNHASRSGSSALASVARLTPFSMPNPSCTTNAHSAPREPRTDAVTAAAMPPQ